MTFNQTVRSALPPALAAGCIWSLQARGGQVQPIPAGEVAKPFEAGLPHRPRTIPFINGSFRSPRTHEDQ